MRYNKYIQQLRGLSILFIILYHYLKSHKNNGFLSVSVFLQISGYIITFCSLNKQFSILHFYYRRFINILPQLYIVIIFVLFLAINQSYNQILNLYEEIISVIVVNTNYYFYKKEIDYFSQFDSPSIVLHFWYMSLQQQIYIIYPILHFIYKKYIFILLLILNFSFLFFSFFIFLNPSFAYYILICRLYEYILGIFINYQSFINRCFYSYSSTNGVIYILITLQLVDINIHTLIKFIMINILSYLLLQLIHLNLVGNEFIINNKIFLIIGNISYELYLIHYPLIHIYTINVILYGITIFTLSYLLSLFKKINKKTLFLISLFFPIIILSFIYKSKIVLNNKFKNTIEAPKIKPIQEYYIVFNDIKKYHPTKIETRNCYFLLGDSHLQQWFPSIIRVAKIKRYAIIHKYFHLYEIENNNLNPIFQSLNKYIKYKITTISSFFTVYIKNISYFKYQFRKYINRVFNYSEKIYIIDDIPLLVVNPLDCIYSKKERKDCYAILGINATYTSIPYVLNLKTVYCNMNKYIYANNKILFVKNRIIVYKDTNHLTLSFSDNLSSHFSNCINK